MSRRRLRSEREFISAFANAIGLSEPRARGQWAEFSRLLSDKELTAIEDGGAPSGRREGQEFVRLYVQPIEPQKGGNDD